MFHSPEWTPTLWSDTFNRMLHEELDYNDTWGFKFNYSLQNNLSNEERRRGWKIYCNYAYGKFRCGTCSKTWPSARITLLFHYRLRSGAARGTVIMRPFGQACRRCNGAFLLPGFSTAEVEKVLLKLIGKIKKNCYGEEEEDNSYCCSSEKVWTKPHESSLCEACRQGICCEED
ncbi:receptor-transporting protein 4-like isoform X1 [Conger conger]|uniref:receptor-transporting protein 4-like isoform X1 n=1 Tax=Conger conger TaxID=82655 RepID=UPI002A5A34EB|nr:receptor-transporting protein 4-like isoform X1 [Conger conger]